MCIMNWFVSPICVLSNETYWFVAFHLFVTKLIHEKQELIWHVYCSGCEWYCFSISYWLHCTLCPFMMLQLIISHLNHSCLAFCYCFSFHLKPLDFIIIMLGYISYFTELTDRLWGISMKLFTVQWCHSLV